MCPGRIAADAAQLAGTAFSELIPPEAQVHLVNAQRELFLALTVTLDHHMRRMQSEEQRARRRQARRPTKIELE